MDRPDEKDPRDADVIDPEVAPEVVQPSTTGTVVPSDDDEDSASTTSAS